jgi:uncharacterized membrane protein YoaK (UPF0700 family)
MLFRRAVFVAMFPAAVLLPLWVLITRGIVADGIGWAFLAYLFACPILFVLMAIVSALITARKSTRDARAVSWRDASVLTALWVAVAASGVFAVPLLAVAVVVLVIGAFWLAAWELLTETRSRVNTFMTGLEATAQGTTSRVSPSNSDVIVITPNESR